MSTIQIRIDQKTKKSAQKVLDALGLDMSAAMRIYLKRVAATRSIPFVVTTENGLTPQEERTILAAAADARHGKRVSRPMAAGDALTYLRSL